MSDCCLIKKVATVEVYENKNEVRAYGFMAGDKNTPMMEVKFKHLWGEENLSKCKLRWIIVDDLGSLLVGEVPIEQDNTASIQLPNELFNGERRMKVQLTVASCDGNRILNLQQFTDLKVINNLASNEVVEPVYQMLINQVYDDTKKYLAELETSYKAKYGSLESVYAKSKASLEQYLINAENGGNAEFLQGYSPVNFIRSENTINELVNSATGKYKIGDIVDLNGYYTAGDGAHHKRKIESADDGSGVQLANGLWANIVHNGEVNVSWFGAKGDGVTDDTDVILKTHTFANKKCKNVKYDRSSCLLKSKSILIETSVDFNYCELLLEKDKGSFFFEIFQNWDVELESSDLLSFSDLPKKDVTSSSLLEKLMGDECHFVSVYGETEREGNYLNDTSYKEDKYALNGRVYRDSVIHYGKGCIASQFNLDFTKVTKIKYKKLNHQIFIKNAKVTVPESQISNNIKFIYCNRNDVKFENFLIDYRNTEVSPSIDKHLLVIANCCNIEINKITGNKAKTNNWFSYWVWGCQVVNLKMSEINKKNITNMTTSDWYTLGFNQSKDVFLTNSVVDRVDCHSSCRNFITEKTQIGYVGISGYGFFKLKECVFSKFYFRVDGHDNMRDGGFWNGDIIIEDSTIVAVENSTIPTNSRRSSVYPEYEENKKVARFKSFTINNLRVISPDGLKTTLIGETSVDCENGIENIVIDNVYGDVETVKIITTSCALSKNKKHTKVRISNVSNVSELMTNNVDTFFQTERNESELIIENCKVFGDVSISSDVCSLKNTIIDGILKIGRGNLGDYDIKKVMISDSTAQTTLSYQKVKELQIESFETNSMSLTSAISDDACLVRICGLHLKGELDLQATNSFVSISNSILEKYNFNFRKLFSDKITVVADTIGFFSDEDFKTSVCLDFKKGWRMIHDPKEFPYENLETGELVASRDYVFVKSATGDKTIPYQTFGSVLNTPYHTTKMQQLGIYGDFISYMDSQHEYDKEQKALESAKQEAYQLALVENSELVYEDWLASYPELMPVHQEPVPSERLMEFYNEYK